MKRSSSRREGKKKLEMPDETSDCVEITLMYVVHNLYKLKYRLSAYLDILKHCPYEHIVAITGVIYKSSSAHNLQNKFGCR